MDNRLGYLLMNEISASILNDTGDSQFKGYKPLQISLFINGRLVVEGNAQKIIEYLSKEYAVFMWFDEIIEQTYSYFNIVHWNIEVEV